MTGHSSLSKLMYAAIKVIIEALYMWVANARTLVMGQEQSNIPSYHGLEPGVYRIVSVSAGTAITIPGCDVGKIEAWELSNDDGQKWLIRPSGDGHTFQNRKYSTYMTVGSTDIQAQVYASKFSTTWELLKQGDHFLINKPGNDRVLDLHWGRSANGNEIHIRPRDNHDCKHWKLEFLKDDIIKQASESTFYILKNLFDL